MAKCKSGIQLVVAADEPALFFTSTGAAESYLEAVDVEEGIYTAAYGVNGEPYRIGVYGGSVVIHLDDEQAPKPDELRALLLLFLANKQPPVRGDEDLATLIQRCEPYVDN